MKLCMCNFHDHTSLVAELSPLKLVNFAKSLLSRALLLYFCKYCSEVVHMQFSCPSVHGHNFVQSFSLTVLHVLLLNLYIMFVYKSCACGIFMTILSLVEELSSLELVNFTELLLSREIILQYCTY